MIYMASSDMYTLPHISAFYPVRRELLLIFIIHFLQKKRLRLSKINQLAQVATLSK